MNSFCHRRTHCTSCEPGSFSNHTASQWCTPCAVGWSELRLIYTEWLCRKVQPKSAQVSCVRCPAGTVAHLEGLTSCVECPLGSHAEETASAKCILDRGTTKMFQLNWTGQWMMAWCCHIEHLLVYIVQRLHMAIRGHWQQYSVGKENGCPYRTPVWPPIASLNLIRLIFEVPFFDTWSNHFISTIMHWLCRRNVWASLESKSSN